MIYAIIKSGGKQLKVEAGKQIWVEKLNIEEGSTFKFDEILAIYDGKELKIGSPRIKGEVLAKVEKQGKAKKVKIFRTKEKSNWDREIGHRQPYTKLTIIEIILDGKSIAKGNPEEKRVKIEPKKEEKIVEQEVEKTIKKEESTTSKEPIKKESSTKEETPKKEES